MSVYFECVTRTDLPRQELFDRSLNIDAHLRSMAASKERAISGVTSGRIGLGEQVTWRARHFGLLIQMTTRITTLDEPTSFTDEQLSGPFKSFCHRHLFSEANGQTTMIDQIHFTAPFGLLGRLVEKLVLEKYLVKLIGQRNESLVADAVATFES